MSVGIQQTEELLNGLGILLAEGKKILADGKVDLSDLPVAFDLLQKFGELSAAVQGADQIPAEIKDLSAEEAQQLIAKVLAMFALAKA